jgi:hypothetical protein
MKAEDKIFHYLGYGTHPSTCRLRLYDGPKGKVAIVSQMEGDQGTSVTNAAEDIASKVCREFSLNHGEVTWVEHYEHTGEQETFDQVEFGISYGRPNNTLANPRWSHLTRQAVAELIGEEP